VRVTRAQRARFEGICRGAEKIAEMLKIRCARAPEEYVWQVSETMGGSIPVTFYFPTLYFDFIASCYSMLDPLIFKITTLFIINGEKL
jgi:hypothetical protein